MAAVPRVKSVERIVVNVPFTPRCEKWNAREVWQWRISEVIRLTTDSNNISGFGETLPHYTWGRVTDEAIQKTIGARLGDLLGDDTLGAGLQMAVYDATAKALGVPLYRLFQLPKVRDWCPISWWNIDMPPDAFAAEAIDAQLAGYTSYKIKARPWWDIYRQVDAISAVSPGQFKLDLDWNQMLLNTGNASAVLNRLDQNERIAIYESPILQRDIEGHRQLRSKTTRPIALHFGDPSFPDVIRHEICDGFVVGGGIVSILKQAHLCAAFDKQFWLQLVGTGITTALSAHLGAVLTNAQWPSVNCMNNYSDDLLVAPLQIVGGCIRVPEEPGLGVELDEDALSHYKMDPPYEIPRPKLLLSVVWATGRVVHYSSMKQCWDDCLAGNQPVQEPGVNMEVNEADGTNTEVDKVFQRALIAPILDQRTNA